MTKFNTPPIETTQKVSKEIASPAAFAAVTTDVAALSDAAIATLTTTEATALTTAAPSALPKSPMEPTIYLTNPNPSSLTRPKAFYIVSQWHITPADAEKCGPDCIEAVNNTTGDRYEGTIADFNAIMRGE